MLYLPAYIWVLPRLLGVWRAGLVAANCQPLLTVSCGCQPLLCLQYWQEFGSCCVQGGEHSTLQLTFAGTAQAATRLSLAIEVIFPDLKYLKMGLQVVY
jgi:hypothetical protein